MSRKLRIELGKHKTPDPIPDSVELEEKRNIAILTSEDGTVMEMMDDNGDIRHYVVDKNGNTKELSSYELDDVAEVLEDRQRRAEERRQRRIARMANATGRTRYRSRRNPETGAFEREDDERPPTPPPARTVSDTGRQIHEGDPETISGPVEMPKSLNQIILEFFADPYTLGGLAVVISMASCSV